MVQTHALEDAPGPPVNGFLFCVGLEFGMVFVVLFLGLLMLDRTDILLAVFFSQHDVGVEMAARVLVFRLNLDLVSATPVRRAYALLFNDLVGC